jgi:hypothetical protein
MAFTLNQLNAVDAAIASGQLSVEYDGKKISYRSMDDLLKARELIRSELIAAGVLTVAPLTNRGPAALTYFSRD